jgi:hypothetical protein
MAASDPIRKRMTKMAGKLAEMVALAAAAALLSGSCGGQSLGGGGSGGTAGAVSAPMDCGVTGELPPILTIVDASNGNPICDATFNAVLVGDASGVDTDPNAHQCDGTTSFGCPAFSTIDSSQPCEFALAGLTYVNVGVNSYSVAIRAPGYVPGLVVGVSGGRAASCGLPPEAPTQVTVKLNPIP